MTDGIILIDKPSGMTSFGVVARVRSALSRQNGVKKMKVGHTGTLDPFATGLMIIAVGQECKNAMHYTKLDKWYEATFRLGMTSTTADPEGELSDVSSAVPSRDRVYEALQSFRGEIQQRPPIYSAIKIDGKRAYHLARQGKITELPSRTVTIYALELLSYAYPYVKISAHVSSGTYIRSLAQDLGDKLGVGAYCTQLRRTAISSWKIESAVTLEEYLSRS